MYRSILRTQRSLSTLGHARLLSNTRIFKLNEISNIEGATKKRKRWGRGTGSGRGKLCGFGHQKSFSTPRGFEGGQTPLYKRLPKIGFHNPSEIDLEVVNVDKIQQFIDMGRLSPKTNEMITMRDLLAAGVVSQVREGIKLLAKGSDSVRTPIHIEVSRASTAAIKAIEAAGGTVTSSHFNKLALRALIKPFKFELLPQRARPTPKLMDYYLDVKKSGYLSPEIQVRNLKLFGHVTSEDACRAEHDRYMDRKRVEYAKIRQQREESLISNGKWPQGVPLPPGWAETKVTNADSV